MLTRIRDSVLDILSDHNQTRYKEDTMLRLINRACEDINTQALILRASISLPIIAGVSEMEIADDFYLLDRVSYNGEELPVISYNEMDEKVSFWERDEGCPECVIYDKQKFDQIKIYPVPSVNCPEIAERIPFYPQDHQDLLIKDIDIYGCVTDSASIDEFNSVFGCVTAMTEAQDGESVENNFDSPFGVVGVYAVALNLASNAFGFVCDIEIEGVAYDFDGFYGVVGYIEEAEFDHMAGTIGDAFIANNTLDIIYIRKPREVSSFEDTIDLPEIYHSAIIYYVAFNFLLFDSDSKNRGYAKDLQGLYVEELKKAIKNSSRNWTKNSRRGLTYDNGFKNNVIEPTQEYRGDVWRTRN
jgi:hypothetical protein